MAACHTLVAIGAPLRCCATSWSHQSAPWTTPRAKERTSNLLSSQNALFNQRWECSYRTNQLLFHATDSGRNKRHMRGVQVSPLMRSSTSNMMGRRAELDNLSNKHPISLRGRTRLTFLFSSVYCRIPSLRDVRHLGARRLQEGPCVKHHDQGTLKCSNAMEICIEVRSQSSHGTLPRFTWVEGTTKSVALPGLRAVLDRAVTARSLRPKCKDVR